MERLGQHGQMTDGAGSDNKSTVEQAVDVFLYAPLGLALEARNLLPQWVERGRQQVTLARMIGHFAVQKGQEGAASALEKASEHVTGVLADLGLLNREPDGVRPDGGASRGPKPARTEPAVVAREVTVEPVPIVVQPAVPLRAGTDSSGLAIADFDSLAASQVIPRLPGLSSDELEDVRSYEFVHRGRKTVLNKIAQLQSA